MKNIPNVYHAFRFWCQKVLPLVYDDSLSYYEVLCKLTNFVNELAERIADAFDEVNKNVQEYVNTWLEEHPEATTTVQDGAVTNTKFNEDTIISNEDVEDSFDDFGYYSGIQTRLFRYLNNDCYLVTIPAEENNEIINPYMKYDRNLTPAQVAQSVGTDVTINGTLSVLTTSNDWITPYVLNRGELIDGGLISQSLKANSVCYLSINSDRSYTEFPITSTLETLQSGGYNVFTAYYRLINSRNKLDLTYITGNEDGRVNNPHPNLAIGFMADRSIVIFGNDGRTQINRGLTSSEVRDYLYDLGCVDAWMLDGGGSMSINVDGCKLNRDIDNWGTEDRMVYDTLNIKKGV